MANALQPAARAAFARGEIDWLSDTIRVVLVNDDYTYDPDDEFLDDVPGGAQIEITDPLDSKTVDDPAGGVLDAGDVLTDAISPGEEITGLWVYQDTGDPSTSRLILWFDTRSDGLPIEVLTTGVPLLIAWPNVATRIARI